MSLALTLRCVAIILICTAVSLGYAATPPPTNAPARKAQPLVLSGAQPIGNALDSASNGTLSAWAPLFQGIEFCEGQAKNPKPLKLYAARIDLQAEGIDFLVTPSNGEDPKDVGARSTSEFLDEFDCQLAINGSVFDAFAKTNGQPMDVEGLSISRGDLYSPPNEWDALLLSTNGEVSIVRSPIEITNAYHGLSGFFTCLVQGTNTGTMKDRHPRTVAGLSKDKRFLILMVIDGRQPGYSEGATTAEAAEWIRRLGAYDALNLDGGGSTTLVMADANGPKVINKPSGPPSGQERRVANHLGVYALPLPKKTH